MCLVGPSISVGALKTLDTQHGKAKVNLICRRPVAKLEVMHIQLRCRERAAVKINMVQWSQGQHVTCWDSIEEPVRANTQLHTWRADDMRPSCSFPKQKFTPLIPTYTHKILKYKVQNSQEIGACGTLRLYLWDAIMVLHLLTKPTQRFSSSYHHTRTSPCSARPDALHNTNEDIPGPLIY